MLILSDADGFGVDFYQLRKGILEASCNGSSASLSHIKVGEFLGGQLACGINGRAGFVDDNVLDRGVQLFNQVYDHLLGLTGGRSIPYGNQGYIVFLISLFSSALASVTLF